MVRARGIKQKITLLINVLHENSSASYELDYNNRIEWN